MKVRELITLLEKLDGDVEVMTRKTEFCGNIGHVNSVSIESYSFFGSPIPCVLLSDEYPEEEDEEDS